VQGGVPALSIAMRVFSLKAEKVGTMHEGLGGSFGTPDRRACTNLAVRRVGTFLLPTDHQQQMSGW
jgi:hypothetical protein